MKYYCPKKWYRNVAGLKPAADEERIQIVLNSHTRITEDYAGGDVGMWRWTHWQGLGVHGSDIKYFRVLKRTPQLVENPSVQLHEMFPERRG